MEEQKKDSTNNKNEFILDGGELMDKVKSIIKEGNARKLTIKNEKDETLLVIPVTWAAVGAILAPVLAAVGAIAAVAAKFKLIVEKR